MQKIDPDDSEARSYAALRDKKLGKFLRQKRGEMTYDEFARTLGTTKSSLYRLEREEESITLRRLQNILDKLKVGITDVFGPDE